jgi:glycosyltransferase involved in cell wall biosynthesis
VLRQAATAGGRPLAGLTSLSRERRNMREVAVVIPVHNGERYLGEAVESALSQTLAPANVVVVDDGSEDATPDVVSRFRSRVDYVRQDRGGAASARNRGVAMTTADLIAFLDADDVWLPDKLQRQVEALPQDEAAVMVFGSVVQFASPDLDDLSRAALQFNSDPMPGLCASTLLLRRRDFMHAGWFDPKLALGDFVEWYARARDAEIGEVALNAVVCRRRLHQNNMSRRLRPDWGDYAKVLKGILDRRRQR